MFPHRSAVFYLTAMLAAAFSLPAAATTVTYNPVSDFSLTANPNGPWSYGYGTAGSGAITLFTQTRVNSGPGYSYSLWTFSGNTIPVVGVGSGLDATNGTVDAPPTDLVMHPGYADDLASILVFTAPTAGTYDLSGLFERDDITTSGTGTDVSICKDTTNCTLYSNYLNPSLGYLSQDPFSLSESLAAGETLDFEVARTGGDSNYDTTGLQLDITSGSIATTPEPSSLMLLGTGVVGLCGVIKRRLRN